MEKQNEPLFEFEKKENLLTQPKFWIMAITGLIILVLSAFFYKSVVKDNLGTDDVAKSMQVIGQDSKWVDKKGLPGEVVIDELQFALPADVPAGNLFVAVGFYTPADQQRLSVPSTADNQVLIGPLTPAQ